MVVFVEETGTKTGYEDAELDGTLLEVETLGDCACGTEDTEVAKKAKVATTAVKKCIVKLCERRRDSWYWLRLEDFLNGEYGHALVSLYRLRSLVHDCAYD